MDPLVELIGVSRHYDMGPVTVTALDRVDLHVDPGEFLVVLGPSGSGKTTLLNLVGALDTPTEGSIRVAGTDITRARPRDLFEFRSRSVSFIFQSFNIFPGLTAEENVRFGIDSAHRKGETSAIDILDSVGLAERAHHFPHELSGGEQQRVAIARALATANPVLLADEPTGELDFQTGVEILELLRSQTTGGKVVIVVTHNREISRIADRVVELSSGRVVSDGPPLGGKAAITDLRW